MKKIVIVFILSLLTACSNEKEVEGTLRLGHEVSSFTDNADQKEYWLQSKS